MSTQPLFGITSFHHWKAAGLLVPGLLALQRGLGRPHRAAFQGGRASRRDHPQSERHGHRAGVDEIRSDGDRQARHEPGGSGRRANRQSRRRPHPPSLPTRLRPDDLRTDFEISVPEDAELQIHDDSGGVNVSNVLGDMNVETIAAGVDLEDAAGYLTVKTVGGSFQCLRCAGRLEVSSISGNFQLIDLRSYYVRAQTSEGNILFNGSFLPNATYVLKNYSGVIEVRFSPGDSFDLSATSLKGKVHNEAKLTPSSHHHLRFEIRQRPVRNVQLRARQGRVELLRWYNQHPQAGLIAPSGSAKRFELR